MKIQKWMLAIWAVSVALPVGAQTQIQEEKRVQVFVHTQDGPGATGGKSAVQFLGGEISLMGPAVTGKPYQAETSTETVQALSDGTRITRRNTSKVFRDKEGRIRREENVTAVGANAPVTPKQTIFIHDPVAKVDYFLDPATKIARKIVLPTDLGSFKVRTDGAGEGAVPPVGGPGFARGAIAIRGGDFAGLPGVRDILMFSGDSANVKTEDLGTKQIEGLTVTGKRTTATIPANTIGNDRAIVSTTETWTSADLGQVISSKTTDPRFGDTTYALTAIQRADQPASLFEVPADYTVKDAGSMRMEYKVKTDGPKNEE